MLLLLYLYHNAVNIKIKYQKIKNKPGQFLNKNLLHRGKPAYSKTTISNEYYNSVKNYQFYFITFFLKKQKFLDCYRGTKKKEKKEKVLRRIFVLKKRKKKS
jgi:hypothetical protein